MPEPGSGQPSRWAPGHGAAPAIVEPVWGPARRMERSTEPELG